MKTKTAYRPKNIPEIKNNAIDPEVAIRAGDDEPIQPSAEPGEAVAEAIQKAVEADEASETLRRQLQHLHASEELQRQHAARMIAARAAQMAAPEPTLPDEPEARIALWKQGGLSDEDATYLQARPDMVQYPMITKAAYAATLHAGIQRDSPDFAAAMEGNFASLLNRVQAQPAQPAAVDPGGFFRAPEPSPRSPAAPDRAALYSAPVSRQTPSGGTGQRPARQITLTPQEQEYARVAGVTDVEYAKQKQKLAIAKANGDYGERR